MALSKLKEDEQRVIFDQLRINSLEPRLAVNFSSTNKELRAFLTCTVQQQLQSDYNEAYSFCIKSGVENCKGLREATQLDVDQATDQDLKILANLSLLLPALEELNLNEPEIGRGGSDVRWFAKALVAGSFPSVTELNIDSHVGDAGASAIADALDRSALPRLKNLSLRDTNIGDAGLVALAPALRRRPLLEDLRFDYNEFSDNGLTALVAPPPIGSTPLPLGGAPPLPKLSYLDIQDTLITHAGCVTLAAALQSGALPALEMLVISHFPLNSAEKANLKKHRPKLSWWTDEDDEAALTLTDDESIDSESEEGEDSTTLANVVASVATTILSSTATALFIFHCFTWKII